MVQNKYICIHKHCTYCDLTHPPPKKKGWVVVVVVVVMLDVEVCYMRYKQW